jgi:hypothetical protein
MNRPVDEDQVRRLLGEDCGRRQGEQRREDEAPEAMQGTSMSGSGYWLRNRNGSFRGRDEPLDAAPDCGTPPS